MDAAKILAQNVDKTQLPPLHQKRVLAFVNHFLINSCSFLNDFAVQCEIKFIELERKLQKVEAALAIIEAKLASIPDQEYEHGEPEIKKHENFNKTPPENNDAMEISKHADNDPKSIKVSEHVLYRKFFKMLQVGVPAQAIKMKMHVEGLDPNMLDNGNLLIPFDESQIENEES